MVSVSDILGIDDQTLLEQLDDDELLFDDYDEYEDDYQGNISSAVNLTSITGILSRILKLVKTTEKVIFGTFFCMVKYSQSSEFT